MVNFIDASCKIWPSIFREKIFESHGNKDVYFPEVGADESFGTIFFFRIINLQSICPFPSK